MSNTIRNLFSEFTFSCTETNLGIVVYAAFNGSYSVICCTRLSDESGSMEITLVSEGDLNRGLLDPSDVFIADTGKELFVWIGGGASPDENKNAMTYAHVSVVFACM